MLNYFVERRGVMSWKLWIVCVILLSIIVMTRANMRARLLKGSSRGNIFLDDNKTINKPISLKRITNKIVLCHTQRKIK